MSLHPEPINGGALAVKYFVSNIFRVLFKKNRYTKIFCSKLATYNQNIGVYWTNNSFKTVFGTFLSLNKKPWLIGWQRFHS